MWPKWILIFCVLAVANNVSAQNSLNYSQLSLWFAHPELVDASDKSPFCCCDSTPRVDVFYIHPSTYYNGLTKNASIQKQSLKKKVKLSLLNEASVFCGLGRIYAPTYRQVRQAVLMRGKPPKKIVAIEKAYGDVRAAFLYFLHEWNNGRPIIIAAHGQGSLHAQRLLSEFFDSLYFPKLVVAYLPGYPLPMDVMDASFSNLTICAEPSAMGCIIPWETYGRHSTMKTSYEHHFWFDGTYQTSETSLPNVVNPLSWLPNQDSVINTKAVQALRPSNNFRIPLRMESYNAETQIINGRLMLKGENRLLFNATAQNYYRFDYNLFYGSIYKNAALRIDSFLHQPPDH